MRRNSLERRKTVQRLEPLLPAMAGFSSAAEGQCDPAAGSVIVEKDLPCAHLARKPHLARAVTCPDAGDKAVLGAVRNGDRLFLGLERDHHLHRTKDFLSGQRMVSAGPRGNLWSGAGDD